MTPDDRIGPYLIVGKLGQGGMGTVYEARHESIGRRVAIKVMKASFAANPELLERFFNEAQAVNVIDHPGLVQVSDCGQLADGAAYLVMEFINGKSLGSRLKELGGPMPVQEAVSVTRQLADALAAAHEKNIVHRDLKPDNIMLVVDPAAPGGIRTKLLDFGIAKVMFPQQPSGVKTKTNALMGTPTYMSPEQCRGAKNVDSKSDVYALGVLLFRMLAGRLPFTGQGAGEIIAKQIYEPPPSLAEFVSGLPGYLIGLMDRLLAKSKDDRPTMRQVVTMLSGSPDDQPTLAGGIHSSTAQTVRRPALGRQADTPQDTAVLASHPGVRTARAQRRSRAFAALGIVSLGVCGALVGLYGARFRSAAAPPLAEPVKRGAPADVLWVLTSTPPGARVLDPAGHRELGRTPLRLQRPATPGVATLTLSLSGYQDRRIEVDQSGNVQLAVTLQPLPRPGADSAAAAPEPTRREPR